MNAASTPVMSTTLGSRMKVPIPVNLGARMASTGRWRGAAGRRLLGTGELGLHRFQALFVNRAHDLVTQLDESGAAQRLERSRPWDVDRKSGPNPSWSAGHHIDDIAQEDRLVDVVGNEEHRLAVALPNVGEQLLHDLPSLRVQGTEGLVHEQRLRIAGQSAGDRGALLHATRQRLGISIRKAVELHQVDQLSRGLATLRRRDLLDLRPEFDV